MSSQQWLRTIDSGPCRRRRFSQIDQRIEFALNGFGPLAVEGERRFQPVEEGAFGWRHAAVGLADAHRHFVGELTLSFVGQRCRGGRQAQSLEQYILIQARQID